MGNKSSKPTSSYASLISVYPDKQDIDFPRESDQDQANAEWIVSQNPNGEIFIKNISASYLRVDEVLLEINQEKRLSGGERIYLDQDQGCPDYMFFRINPMSDLKRGPLTLESEKIQKLIKIENDLPKELTCSICTNFLHKCMVLVPCQHSFCSFCLFDHLKLSSRCPLCRTEAASVAKNPILSSVIQFVKENFSVLHKSQERKELEEINFGGAIIRNPQDVYIGSCVNGKKDGQGKLILKNGGIYEGSWKNDKREGEGVLILGNGNRYEGYWMNNCFHGRGKYLWKNGQMYEGNFEAGNFSGYGVKTYENGRIYQGEWKNDNKDGNGRFIFPNGDKYEGKWVKDVLQPEVKIEYSNGEKYEGEINIEDFKRRGKGVLWRNGNKYEGSWKSDALQPQVKIEYSNGKKYEGEINVENLQRHGKGILIIPNGDKYKGTWADDILQHQEVTIEYSNGDIYEGEIDIQDFKRQGKGVLISSDGDEYNGDWVDDKQHGHGKCTWKKNALVFEGLWEEGKFTGVEIMTYADGTRFKGKWEKLEESESRQEDSLKEKKGINGING